MTWMCMALSASVPFAALASAPARAVTANASAVAAMLMISWTVSHPGVPPAMIERSVDVSSPMAVIASPP